MTLADLAQMFDGAAHDYAVICAGTRGEVTTCHGAPDRWDWGVTLVTLAQAQQRHARLERVVAEMTPEQRAALWVDTSPVAAELRRIASR